jgi:hypothetical protein
MADDVYSNAVHQQPAPNIDTNDKIESQRLVETNDATKTDEVNSNSKDSLKINSYGTASTKNYVAKPFAATTSSNNDNLNECPPTPFISNTTNSKASLQSYLEKTPNNTSTEDMVIDITTTPIPPPDRSPTSKKYFQRKTPQSQDHGLPTPNVPPIRPFTLGQTINMSSLATAANDTQAPTARIDNDHRTQDTVSLDNQSISSMDTSDRSKTLLKPKSIFNPYNKQHRLEVQSHKNTIEVSSMNNTNNDTPSQTIDTTSNIKTNLLIPTTHLPSTNNIDRSQTHDPMIHELSQEDTELISKEIAKQEQQQKWQEVKVKTPSRKQETQAQDKPKQTDPNPYSVLQDDDTDNELFVITKDNQIHNDSPNEIDNTQMSTIYTNETEKQPQTNAGHATNNTKSVQTNAKKHTPGRNRNVNPGRGGGIRSNNMSPKNNITQTHTDTNTEVMDIDDPPRISTSVNQQTDNTNPEPPIPNHDPEKDHNRKDNNNGNRDQQKSNRRTNVLKHSCARILKRERSRKLYKTQNT